MLHKEEDGVHPFVKLIRNETVLKAKEMLATKVMKELKPMMARREFKKKNGNESSITNK